MELLRGGSEEGKVKTAGALWDLAASTDAIRRAVVEAGGIPLYGGAAARRLRGG